MTLRLLLPAILLGCFTLSPATAQQAAPAKPLPVKAPAEKLDGPPLVSAKGWAIADGKTGKLLWGGQETTALVMASTTKIMTAWIVLPLAREKPETLEEIVVVSERAAKTGGSSAKVLVGE